MVSKSSTKAASSLHLHLSSSSSSSAAMTEKNTRSSTISTPQLTLDLSSQIAKPLAYAGLEMSDSDESPILAPMRKPVARKSTTTRIRLPSLNLSSTRSSMAISNSARSSTAKTPAATDRSRVLKGDSDVENSDEDFRPSRWRTKEQLLSLGATIGQRFTARITHVVMWNGREQIAKRAIERDPPAIIVSPRWLKMCVDTGTRVPETAANQLGFSTKVTDLTSPGYGLVAPPPPMSALARRRLEYRGLDAQLRLSARRVRNQERAAQDRALLAEFEAWRSGGSASASSSTNTQAAVQDDSEFVREWMEINEALEDYLRQLREPNWGVPLRERVRLLKEKNNAILPPPPSRPLVEDHVVPAIQNDMQPIRDAHKNVRVLRRRTIAVIPMTGNENNQSVIPKKRPLFPAPATVGDLPPAQLDALLRRTAPRSRRRLNMPLARLLKWLEEQHAADNAGTSTNQQNAVGDKEATTAKKRQKKADNTVAVIKPIEAVKTQTKTVSVQSLVSATPRNAGKKTDSFGGFWIRTRSALLNQLQSAPSSEEFVSAKTKGASTVSRQTKKRKLIDAVETTDEELRITPVMDQLHQTPKRRGASRALSGRIVVSRLDKNERESVNAIVRQLGGLTANAVDDSTTVVIGGEHRTVTVLLAVVNGKPVVTTEWVYRSLEQGAWLPFAEYLHPDWKNAVSNRMAGKSRLFTSANVFYLSPYCSPKPKDLAEFIKKSGGKVTDSLGRCTMVIAPAMDGIPPTRKSIADMPVVTEKWLLDSIQSDQWQPFGDYRLN